MHPADFADKWRALAPRTTEKASYQEHWRDLCALLGQPTPSSDTTGQDYAFEKHVKKVGTGETGFADVFKRDHFIVEYKAQGKSLGKAWQQAVMYAAELGNPPLLLVCDLTILEIHTNFTGSAPRTIRLSLDDIAADAPVGGDMTALSALRACFREPGLLDPRLLRERVTADATARVGQVAQALTARGTTQTTAAHFLMRVVFAMFSEDVGLLTRGLLTKLLKRAREYPDRSQGYFQELFTAMQNGGEFWGDDVRHFNGGLFDDGAALAITQDDAHALIGASTLDWAQVEPAIFGTLFENSLDAKTRSKRGAHYTAVRDIRRITEPVVMVPLRREWAVVKAEAEALAGKRGGKAAALKVVQAFHARLGQVRVLDPACGSGNFLVVALGGLLDLEQEVRLLGAELGAGPFAMPPRVHPRNLLGIEVEAFAFELASVSVWIAYFQWKAAHGGEWETPVLQRLESIQHRDALLNGDGTEAQWPAAEFIVGNPPFLGGKMLRTNLGDEYVDRLFRAYSGEVARESDLVCYWFEKARQALPGGLTRRVGLVTTNSIRGGVNRQVLQRIQETGALFNVWSDEPWLQDGAAVRVSLVCFDDGEEAARALNGQPAARINSDLTASTDITSAQPLPENAGVSFMGTTKGGAFDISSEVAQKWLALPNPDGHSNADVIKPWVNGMDLTRRPRDMWVVDFGMMPETQASHYLTPFEYVRENVLPERKDNKRDSYRQLWWLHAEPRPAMRKAFIGLSRYIATSIVAKHRIFSWLDVNVVPSNAVVAFARDDDFTFGVLHSHIHGLWALVLGTALEDRPRYTASTCFETFPFPEPNDEQRTEIEKWARYVVQVRAHLLGQDAKATLTGLYNDVVRLQETPDSAHPVAALVIAHARLDSAVAAAYGWEWPLAEDEVLARLLALNLERAGAGT